MLLERLESALNRNIAQSRAALSALRQLDGKVLALKAQGTPLELFFRSSEGRMQVLTRYDGPADTSLSGTPLALLSLVGPQAEERLRGRAIRIEGDAETAQKFRDLFKHAQPDFEEELARVIGDIAAHRLAGVARGLAGWGRRASASLGANLAEYLQEEGRDLPTRVEVEEFLAGVDELREATDRCEARLGRLAAKRH